MGVEQRSEIKTNFEVTVPISFALETAAFIEGRLDRIKRDLRDRGMIASKITITTVTVDQEKK